MTMMIMTIMIMTIITCIERMKKKEYLYNGVKSILFKRLKSPPHCHPNCLKEQVQNISWSMTNKSSLFPNKIV